MIPADRLNQMDAEATAITARGTVAGLALGTFVLELTAEVLRLQARLNDIAEDRDRSQRVARKLHLGQALTAEDLEGGDYLYTAE